MFPFSTSGAIQSAVPTPPVIIPWQSPDGPEGNAGMNLCSAKMDAKAANTGRIFSSSGWELDVTRRWGPNQRDSCPQEVPMSAAEAG